MTYHEIRYKMAEEYISLIRRGILAKVAIAKLMKKYGVSRPTIYRNVRRANIA